MGYEPGAHAVPGPLDPEVDAAATYLLEPEETAPLLARIVTSHEEGTRRVVAPATGHVLVDLPLSGPDDVTRAVDRARDAQVAWAATDVRERAAVLLRLHDHVLDHQSEVLDLIQRESGKSRASAFEEVADVAQVARHYGRRAAAYLEPRTVRGMLPLLTRTTVARLPVGVVGVISPWNYPLTLALADVLPALVAGNAVVLKPDPQTTLTALWAAAALEEAGLPDDVLQVVAGGGEVGAALVDEVDHIAFTGSTATGRVIASRAGERLIGATLELGGKNPLYVAADADLEVAALGAVRACFSNSGQLCMSIERLVLHEDVAEEFLELFLARVLALRLSPALDYTADVGSLTSSAQLARVETHVHDAIARGARILAGGVHRTDVGPLFYSPTVLADVPPHALCAQEETFGPVVSVVLVSSDDEAVTVMNETEHGLNASIWSRDTRRARALAARVRAGTVNVNDGYAAAWGSVAAPMGGFGASGQGRRHGREGIEACTEAQTVSVQRGVMSGASLDELFALPDGQGQRLLTGGLRLLRTLRLR
ncbi:NAD-dependent aldehyde dehydrogenase [Sanguibacter keddieii DSM 10542]|uniref:Aldehyde dehydrogenase n=1 Tax=Sanguibacter keddieii (strain ATCC 51767 / DSM 10542 / NCFB 3025 / ST-74) TaxID=446469 RepID=D1BBI7_SANKS|nr:succinic semialdehyde dehydrogenase [Sanguibacter keddieii]ACZ22758.1 NAD-dependent aldehyde dehydrogenase [Sanguibacter keddieii DSM 10542]